MMRDMLAQQDELSQRVGKLERQHSVKPPAPQSIEPITKTPQTEPPKKRHCRRSRKYKDEAVPESTQASHANVTVNSTENTSVLDAGSGVDKG